MSSKITKESLVVEYKLPVLMNELHSKQVGTCLGDMGPKVDFHLKKFKTGSWDRLGCPHMGSGIGVSKWTCLNRFYLVTGENSWDPLANRCMGYIVYTPCRNINGFGQMWFIKRFWYGPFNIGVYGKYHLFYFTQETYLSEDLGEIYIWKNL